MFGLQRDQTSQFQRKSTLNIHWKNWSWSSNTLATQRADSLEKTLILGKIEGKRRSRWQSMICLGSITDSMDMSLSKLGDSEGQEVWRAAIHGVAKNWTWLSDWTATTNLRGYWSMQDPLLVSLPEWCFGESNSLAWEFKAWIAWKNQKTSWLRHWT